MNSFDELMTAVLRALAGPAAEHGFLLRQAFEPQLRESPLAASVVTVSVTQAVGKSGAFYDLVGEEEDGAPVQYHGKQFAVTLLLSITTPAEQGGERCAALFGALADALLLHELTGVRVGAMQAREIGYDKTLRAFTMPVEVALQVFLMKAREGTGFREVVVAKDE